MRFKGLAILALACLSLGALSFDAQANTQEPSSVLLFPYYNTNPGNFTFITITNTCTSVDPITVRIVFVDDVECTPEDVWVELTGKDTYTFLANAVNPELEQGFLYAYVVDPADPLLVNELAMDCLIGQEYVIGNFGTGAVANFAINAVGFKTGTGAITADGKLHLDGVEFELAPYMVYFPRFFGQDANFISFVILINLTGGKYFIHGADLRVYNDNEQGWSSHIQFPCFVFLPLVNVSNAVTENWLDNSNNDPDEIVGLTGKESGWIEFTGGEASYFITDIPNASLYAVLIEEVATFYGADLPWALTDATDYINGMLWSTSVTGD
jgi:hypothetical protein